MLIISISAISCQLLIPASPTNSTAMLDFVLHCYFKFPLIISYFSCARRNVVYECNKTAGNVTITQHDSKIYFSR